MRNIMRDPIEKNMLYERIQRYVRNMVGSRLLCPECKELKTCEGLEGRKMRPVLDCGHRRMEYESALTRNLTDEEFKKLMAEQRVFEAKRKKKYAGTKPLSTPAGATLQNVVGYVQTCGLNVTNTVTTNVEPSVDVLRSERSIIGENNE